MTAEEEPPEEKRMPREPPLPAPETEEKPLFNLRDLIQARKRGEISVLDYAILTDIMERREDRKEDRAFKRQQMERSIQGSPSSNPEVEGLKTELAELRKTVGDLVETIHSKAQAEAQEKFVEGVVKQTTDKLMPELQALKERLETFEQTAPSELTSETSELKEIRDSLKEITDKIGEKIGAKGMTLSDVEQLMGVVESIEKRIIKRGGEGGEVDYKTMAVSTVGEIGKELITAYRDITTSQSGLETPKTETPASTMQTIIKRQVRNFITNRMKVGATTMNIEEAAKELGLTPGQVMWAYQTLMKEGWFHVQIPSKGKKKVKETETISPPEETTSTETIEEEEQVFNPPET